MPLPFSNALCVCVFFLQDIALILPSSSESILSELEQLSNSLPGKELIASICDCLIETVINAESSYTCLLTCIRTMMFLTEHNYGFYHLKRYNFPISNVSKSTCKFCAIPIRFQWTLVISVQHQKKMLQ